MVSCWIGLWDSSIQIEMLIHLNIALAEKLKEEIERTEAVVQALQNLAQARYQGDHIITADNGVLEHIISSEALNQNTRRVFTKIDEEQAQVGILRNKLTAHVEITSVKGTITKTKKGDIDIIQVPLVRFERNDIIQPTFFITENLLDCEYYLKITSWFSKQYSNGELPSKLSAVYCPGGGDTTEKLLDHHSKNQRYLTLCITDRDQRFPGSGIGETSKKCERLVLDDLSYHTILPVRAVENLISATQISSVLNASKERKALIPRLTRLARLIESEAWKYFHVKNGVRELHGPHQAETEGAYWYSTATPDDVRNSAIDGYLFPPVSSSLLLWVVDHLETNDPDDFSNENQLLTIWKDLAKLIASWTCGCEPMRA